MNERWLVIRVVLLSGAGETLDPPPGRDFLVSSEHPFAMLAEAINAGFARWDLGHLCAFHLEDSTRVTIDPEDPDELDAEETKVGTLDVGDGFDFEFDFGDSWTHRCTVIDAGVDPVESFGERPRAPVAIWGWGSIPDQYGRTSPDD